MEETKKLIQAFLEEQFAKSLWPFTSRVILFSKFGEHTDAALRALYSEGIVFPRRGVNGLLIQLIVNKDKKIEAENREKVRNHFLKFNK